jgi:hypothetical protein
MFCPFVNVVFHFVLVLNIAKSLENEFARREISLAGRYSPTSFGIAMCVLSAAAFPFALIPGSFGQGFWISTSVAALAFWMMYWAKIDRCSSRIAAPFPTPSDSGSVA